MTFSYSQVECFESCKWKWFLRYKENLQVLPDDAPDNPMYLGSGMHKGIETTVEEGIREYFSNYPVIDDRHITEAMKLEYLIPKVKELLPEERLHEYHIEDDFFNGYLDLLIPCTKHDMNLKYGQFDLYDFKYSNNISHYMQTAQLHVYKYMTEKITGKRIRNLYLIFIPKVTLKQLNNEPVQIYRQRIMNELEKKQVEIKSVEYDPVKVIHWFESVRKIEHAETFEKNEQFLCKFCNYQEFCLKGKDYMVLPSTERRQVGQTTKRKIWIYGGAFSGKTTFVDSAPNPLNLNTDGNIQFVTMPYVAIKDTYEGRQKKLAWTVFKDTIDELERKDNDFKTIVVDLLEDTYQSCRLYMYDKLGIKHESDDTFRAWDEVRTEFLSTIRRLMNLDYENIILISHEDTSRDITRRSGDKTTSIKPNIQEKIANKIAGMVDIVARVVVDGDARTLEFKSDEVVFGGGRLHGINHTSIPLDWNKLMQVYDEANFNAGHTESRQIQPKEEKMDNSVSVSKRDRKRTKTANSEGEEKPAPEQDIKQVDTGTGTVVGADVEELKQIESEDKPEEKEQEEKPVRRSRRDRKADSAEEAPVEKVSVEVVEAEVVEEKPARRTRRTRKEGNE